MNAGLGREQAGILPEHTKIEFANTLNHQQHNIMHGSNQEIKDMHSFNI
jgi:phage gp29-like protein